MRRLRCVNEHFHGPVETPRSKVEPGHVSARAWRANGVCLVGIGEFFAWWKTELAGLLPDALRRQSARRRHTLLLSLSDGEVLISRRENGHLEELGRVGATMPDASERAAAILGRLKSAATRVEVAVPPSKLLVKQIRLPLAAEENLREVLGYEMQRQTPFRAEQVYFNFRTTARWPQSQQIAVKLCVVPRSEIGPILAPFADWNLVPFHVGRKSDHGDEIFTFVRGDATQKSSSRLHRGLFVLNLLLLVAVVAIPFAQQQHYLGQLRVRLDEVRDAAKTASDLQQRIDRKQERARYLFAQKVERPAAVELLEELSRRLPDDTWLFRVEMRDGKVFVQGTSTTASALIAELEDSRFLEDVRFASPVTQDGASGRERFHLSAKIIAPAGRDPLASSAGGDT